MGLAAGGLARIGLLAPAAMTGVLASIAPPQQWSDVWLFAVFMVLGAANAILLARRLGLPVGTAGQRLSRDRAVAVSVVLGGVGALSAAIAAHWGAPHAYWLPMTVFLIAVPTAGVLVHRKAVARLLGTLAGVAGSALLLPIGVPRALDLLLGGLCLLFSLAYLRPVWLNAALSSAATVLLLTGGGSDQVGTSLIRVEAVVLGSGLLLAGIAVVAVIARLRPPSSEEQALAGAYDPAGVHG